MVLSDVDLAFLNSSQGFKIEGAAVGDHAGYKVRAIDVDGDGLAEIIIGAEGFNRWSGGVDAGAVYVIWGTNTEGMNYTEAVANP